MANSGGGSPGVTPTSAAKQAEQTTISLEDSPLLDRGSSSLTPKEHLSAPLSAGIQPKRSIGAISLAFLAYVAVCGGPFGIEPAVGAAGLLPTLIALLVAGIFWALPQAVLTAELSCMFDENGGYVVWVQESLGPFWGFVNGYNAVISNLSDLPLYPVLYAGYLRKFFHMGIILEWVVKVFSLCLVVTFNILGMETVAITSVIFTMIVLTPFIMEPFMITPAPAPWLEVPAGIEWNVFMATILWNFQGWNTLGCIAGEVKNAKRSYPIGVIVAIIMIVLTYGIPIMVGIVVEPDTTKWGSEGGKVDLVDIARQVESWLGILALIAATLAVIGEFSAAMSSSSRAMQRMAGYGMIPHLLVKNKTRFATPVNSIILEAGLTGVLMMFDFSTLAILTTLFNCVSIVLQIVGFLKLKFQKPDMERPFRIPLGRVGALLVTVPQLIIVAYTLFSFGISWQMLVGLVINLIFLLSAHFWAKRSGRRECRDFGSTTEPSP